MPRARALVAAVPQRVWTAVAGLVLLASLGVTLVLTAGLSTWQGGVSKGPAKGNARPPSSVVTPPGSAVIVVPTPHTNPPVTPTTPGGTGTVPAVPVVAGPASVPAVSTPDLPLPVPPVTVPVPVTANPHIARGDVAGVPGAHGHHGKHGKAGTHGRHGNHGKHLGWVHNKHA